MCFSVCCCFFDKVLNSIKNSDKKKTRIGKESSLYSNFESLILKLINRLKKKSIPMIIDQTSQLTSKEKNIL